MQSHPRLQSRHSLLAILAIAVLALAVMAPGTLAQQTTAPGPPNFPTAIPAYPGALTDSHDRAMAAALAQQRYYSSYGTPTPLTATARPIPVVDTHDGIATLPFALALAGALIVGIAATSSLRALHGRRRRRAGHPA